MQQAASERAPNSAVNPTAAPTSPRSSREPAATHIMVDTHASSTMRAEAAIEGKRIAAPPQLGSKIAVKRYDIRFAPLLDGNGDQKKSSQACVNCLILSVAERIM